MLSKLITLSSHLSESENAILKHQDWVETLHHQESTQVSLQVPHNLYLPSWGQSILSLLLAQLLFGGC
jgi:hypothetical protein